jgi:Fur family ferric uptake transcriptional regulator
MIMSEAKQLITDLKNQGERITIVRREIITILTENNKPLSANEIIKLLAERRLSVNKTTVYRQLDLLQEYNMIHEIRLNDRTRRFEISQKQEDHHHHLVCLKCKKIEDINFEEDLTRQERIIQKKKGFKVLQHSLEFFGLCKNCQKKRNK